MVLRHHPVRQGLTACTAREYGSPSSAAHSSGPTCSKSRSARREVTMPVSVSMVAKLHLKAMSPGAMGMPAPMLSNAPRPR